MKDYTKEDVIRLVEEEDVEFIRLQFTDLYGNLKNVAITASQLEKALDNQCMFDGSAINGFARVEESDMYLYPDFSTLEIFPWRPQQGKVARMICDIYKSNGEAFEGDSRNVLKRAVCEAQEEGYVMEVGPECEFFLFDTDEQTMPTTQTQEQAGFFDIGPLDFGENARRDIVMNLEEMGLEILSSHHEKSPAQHEIDFKYDEALQTADNIQTFRLAVRTIAKRHGLHATFMPQPKEGVNGSGMHLHFSLKKDGKDVFRDENDANGLSQDGYYFIGGLMKHIKGMAAITNPLVNSYKRLVPGYDAPVYIAWSTNNRSPLIRIPHTGKGQSARIELRNPDPSANPYLTLAVCLKAGLDGIRNKILPPACVTQNLFAMTDEERREKGIDMLPENLLLAVEELEKDDLLLDVLGREVSEKYIAAKKEEFARYRAQVSAWEISEYLYRY